MPREQQSATRSRKAARPSTGWALEPLRPSRVKRKYTNGQPMRSADNGAPRYVIPSTGHVPGRFREADEFRRELGLKR
jgi:hypothetical protein